MTMIEEEVCLEIMIILMMLLERDYYNEPRTVIL
jgi:hypothetical protein